MFQVRIVRNRGGTYTNMATMTVYGPRNAGDTTTTGTGGGYGPTFAAASRLADADLQRKLPAADCVEGDIFLAEARIISQHGGDGATPQQRADHRSLRFTAAETILEASPIGP